MFFIILSTLFISVVFLLLYIFLCAYFIELKYKSLASRLWKNSEYKYIIAKDKTYSKEYKIKKMES